MEKTKITKIMNTWRGISLMMLMLVGFSFNVSAQAVSCNNNVQISVDGTCFAVVTPDMILEGTYPNMANFTVSIDGGGNIVNPAMVGLTLPVTVTSPTGNSCWGTITIEDKIAPTITCADVTISCDDALPAAPTATDGCGNVSVSMVSSTVVDNGCAGTFSEVITRVWEATDGSGNTASCTQVISRERATLATVVFPGNVTTDCANNENDVYQNTNSSNTYTFTTNAALVGTLVSGEPTGAGCGDIVITKVDEIVPICDGSYKVLRTWTAIDWCAAVGNNTATATQIVKIEDTTGPVVTTPATIVVGASSNSCSGNVFLPNLFATDDCSAVNAAEFTLAGAVIQNGILTNAPLGTHTIGYTVEDACGNASVGTFDIEVIDNIAPLAICDEFTQIGIGSDGTSVVPAAVFDDGSYDNCGIVSMEVRRMTDPCHFPPQLGWKPAAEFCCADVGTTVDVEFRVTDAAGNTNSCMVQVLIEDKIAPQIICPPAKTINCTDDYTDTALTGEALATDNCSSVTPSFVDNANINDCGEGTVTRIWSVTDDSGNSASCVQFITINNATPFFICDTEPRNTPFGSCFTGHTSSDDVEWPADIDLNTCGLGLEPADLEANYPLDARPIVSASACGSVGVTKEDLTLAIQGDACLKIIRTWTIIDWCQYDVNNPAAGGRWDYVQVIKVLNSSAPTVNCGNSDSFVQNFEANCGGTFVNLFIDANDDCTAQADLIYSYTVENGNGTVIQTGNTNNASDAFNNGSYKVTWSVADGCGNTEVCVHDFTVVDAKKPTPVCLNGLATVIMPSSGSVTLWASDFESGSSFDNCTPYSALQFSFSSDVTDTDMEFTCNTIAGGTSVPVEIWVTDGSGNQDFCVTYIQVQDPNSACGPTAAGAIEPAGVIETEESLEVEDVTVNLDGSVMTALTTGANGQFTFGSMPAPTTGAYVVRPEKNMNPLNGVSTFDLVLISKHILGTQTLDSPYKQIAADANGSESITTFDIVVLRRLILQIDTEFPAGQSSWRFVDATHDFSNGVFPFAETVDVSAAGTANFVGVKIGDVNESASPNNLLGTDTRTFAGDLVFQLEDKQVQAGEEFTVDFKAKDFNNTLGYQFTLGFDNAEFVGVKSNLTNLDDSNFGLALLEEGVITTSWNTNEAVNVEDNATLFSVTFTATETTNISDIVNINSRYTTSEAYGGTPNGSDLYNVALAFNGEVATNDFKVYQNTPNPFKDVTTIGFNLPTAATTTVNVFDVSGKVLRSVEVEGVKGYNMVELNRAQLSATGVLYYQVQTADHTATMKMILVD